MGEVREAEARMLLCFARRMATYAVQIGSPIQVRFGLLASMLGLRGEDRREVLIVLGILYDAGNRSGGDAVMLFNQVAREVPAEGSALLLGFLRRPDLDSVLDKMGFQAGSDDAGKFQYQSRRAVPRELVEQVLSKFRR
jgi:hypothetical protein